MPPCGTMAGAHCATASELLSFTRITTAMPTYSHRFVVLSSVSTQFPRRLTRRRNYLREKLRKTSKKPYPDPLVPELPLTNPSTPVEYPPLETPNLEAQVAGDELKETEVAEFQASTVSESSVLLSVADGGKLWKNVIFSIGVLFVGGLVIGAFSAVWMVESVDFDDKDGKLDSKVRNKLLELELKRESKSKPNRISRSGNGEGIRIFRNDRDVNLDLEAIEKKVEEIQILAREAREHERKNSRKNGSFDDDDHSDGDNEDEEAKHDEMSFQTGIKKEVDDRLVRLRKTLTKGNEKLLARGVNYLEKDSKMKDKNKSGKDGNDALMFKKKKIKFGNIANLGSSKPKGFSSSNGTTFTEEKEARMDEGGKPLPGDTKLEHLAEEKVLGSSHDRIDNPSNFDESHESTTKREVIEPKGTTDQSPGKVRVRKELVNAVDGSISELTNGHPPSFDNGSLKSTGSRKKQLVYKAEDRNSKGKTTFWWLSLPYVLIVRICEGQGGEGRDAPFTIKAAKATSSSEDGLFYTVAFEDRVDATNFCYLLESYFEDLDDFNADIIPLPTKDLAERAASRAMNIIVVKKGQLQLYAGQPLPDVEEALNALIERL